MSWGSRPRRLIFIPTSSFVLTLRPCPQFWCGFFSISTRPSRHQGYGGDPNSGEHTGSGGNVWRKRKYVTARPVVGRYRSWCLTLKVPQRRESRAVSERRELSASSPGLVQSAQPWLAARVRTAPRPPTGRESVWIRERSPAPPITSAGCSPLYPSILRALLTALACEAEAGARTVTSVGAVLAGGTGTDLHSKQVSATARALILLTVFKLWVPGWQGLYKLSKSQTALRNLIFTSCPRRMTSLLCEWAARCAGQRPSGTPANSRLMPLRPRRWGLPSYISLGWKVGFDRFINALGQLTGSSCPYLINDIGCCWWDRLSIFNSGVCR